MTIDSDIMERAIEIFGKISEGRVDEHAIASALQAERDDTEAKWAEAMKTPLSVRVNYLRGNIACQNLIDEAVDAERERCAKIADAYSEDYDKALYLYGAADLDSGRGRQEGHIKAGKEIAAAIREAK